MCDGIPGYRNHYTLTFFLSPQGRGNLQPIPRNALQVHDVGIPDISTTTGLIISFN
jgi:hypothetical protein